MFNTLGLGRSAWCVGFWLCLKNIGSTSRTICLLLLKDLAGQSSFYKFRYKIVSSSNFSSRLWFCFAKTLTPLQHPFAIWTVPAQLMIEWSDRSAFNLTQFIFRVVYIKLYRINKHRKVVCSLLQSAPTKGKRSKRRLNTISDRRQTYHINLCWSNPYSAYSPTQKNKSFTEK